MTAAKINKISCACVIPLYNHAKTVLDIAEKAKQYISYVTVIDDGSSDLPDNFDKLLAEKGISMIRHSKNKGKGAALKTAAKNLAEQGFDYMITIDADGQHSPDDIPLFIEAIEKNQNSVIIGCRNFNTENIPEMTKLGRKISNFWYKINTGISCGDTQSGFRAYPVKAFSKIKLHCNRYNFETEALIKFAIAEYKPFDIPIKVFYPPENKRISHFNLLRDNFQIALIHLYFTARLLFLLPFRIIKK